MIVAIVGCHGAGKSTLGRALSVRLGWVFHEEIGARLAAEGRLRPPGIVAADLQETFDEAVFAEELARDSAWELRAHRLVETWHPGNLAYAAARSSRVAERYLGRIVDSITRQPAAILEIVAPDEVLARRQSEPGPPAFFRKVATATQAIARRLDLPSLGRVASQERAADELAWELAPRILAAAEKGGFQ